MRADIAAAIAAVTATAKYHAQALRVLDSVAERKVCAATAQRVIDTARDIVASVTGSIVEAERPKGPAVRAAYGRAGDVIGGARVEELARTTPKRAIMVGGRAYDLATGTEVNAGGRHGREWRIHTDDLPMVRAAKPGPTAVSKALDVIAKDQERARG